MAAPKNMTPYQKTLRARAATHAKWAKTEDRTAATAPARAGFMARFERQVDPDGVLDPVERAKRAHSAMRSHMASIRLKGSKKKAS